MRRRPSRLGKGGPITQHPSRPAINVGLRIASAGDVHVGDNVDVEIVLITAAGHAHGEFFTSQTYLLEWDPARLGLRGHSALQDYRLCDFLPGDADGINDHLDDGIGLLRVWPRPCGHFQVTPDEPFVVARLHFQATQEGIADLSPVRKAGPRLWTAVYKAGFDLVANLQGLSINILPGAVAARRQQAAHAKDHPVKLGTCRMEITHGHTDGTPSR